MAKKTIKINFANFWQGFNPENNYFVNILKMKYNVKISAEPDYMFYSVYPQGEIKSKDISKKGDMIRKISPRLYVLIRKLYSMLNGPKEDRTIAPKGNFIKIFYSSEHVRPNMNKCEWAFGSHLEEDIKHANYFRIPMDLVTNYPLNKEMVLPFKREIDFKKIKKEKTLFCNFIYAQENNPRNNFFKELSKYKRVDSPGRCMNNMSSISHGSPKESRLSKSWVGLKLDFIKKYKFTIAFENRVENGWTTEKLTHPLLVNSVPIYFGNKLVWKDFNPKCFINVSDFKNVKEVIKHVIKVDKDDELYRQYLEQPIFKDKDSLYIDNEEKILKILSKIVESKK